MVSPQSCSLTVPSLHFLSFSPLSFRPSLFPFSPCMLQPANLTSHFQYVTTVTKANKNTLPTHHFALTPHTTVPMINAFRQSLCYVAQVSHLLICLSTYRTPSHVRSLLTDA